MLRSLRLSVALGVLACVAGAQDKPKIKMVPPSSTNPASGQEMFGAYCSACHGKEAKGNGPAAPALKTQPPDLTMLSRRNGGKFPSAKVYTVIVGDSEMAAHGSKDMPVWGDVLKSMTRNEAEVKMRLHNLTVYLESIQQK
jgi:mono/diheme cytochrome c family protein